MAITMLLLSLAMLIDKEERRGFEEEDLPPTVFRILVLGFLVFVCILGLVLMMSLP